MTKNPDVRFAKSIVDYIFRWMATKFLSPEAQFRAGVNNREELVTTPEQLPLDVAAAAGASATARHRVAADVVVRRDAEPGGRAAVLDLRVDHGALGLVLQVRELRHDERLRVDTPGARKVGASGVGMVRKGAAQCRPFLLGAIELTSSPERGFPSSRSARISCPRYFVTHEPIAVRRWPPSRRRSSPSSAAGRPRPRARSRSGRASSRTGRRAEADRRGAAVRRRR